MKKILFILVCIITSMTLQAQSYYTNNDWNNTAIGVGYSYLDRDDYKDNCIDIWANIFGVYMDFSIGTELKDYNQYSDKSSSTINIGYTFPINIDDNSRLLIGPVVGCTSIKYGHDYYDPYYDCVCDSYFNFGGVIGYRISHFQINGKITRNQLGISLGYAF